MSRPTPQEAMIYLMVMTSAADRDMTDSELSRIGTLIRTLPVFKDFDAGRTIDVARQCQELLQQDGGMEGALRVVAQSIPASLRETAYLLAVEIAAADLDIKAEELRMLQLWAERLEIEPLAVAAIERAARARYRRLGS